jgi:uncharacterized protein YgfB (UPF0149 family)
MGLHGNEAVIGLAAGALGLMAAPLGGMAGGLVRGGIRSGYWQADVGDSRQVPQKGMMSSATIFMKYAARDAARE